MSIVATTKTKKGQKYLRRRCVAEQFISACVALPDIAKASVEQFLALPAYGDASMDDYTPGPKRPRVESQHSLCGYVTEPVLETWARWAWIIKNASLTEFERREAVRMMLGVLILQKGKFSLTKSQLREGAEEAIKWTMWGKEHRAQARLQNSPGYKSWLEATASGIGLEEATMQYDALVRNASVYGGP